MNDQVIVSDLDRRPATLSTDRVAKRLVHVEVRNRITVLVRLRLLVNRLPGSAGFRFMLAGLVFASDVEQFLDRPTFHPLDALRSHLKSSALIAVDVASIDELLHDVGMFLAKLLEVVEHELAIIHHVLRELIEEFVRRLRSKLLRPVPACVFKIRHEAVRRWLDERCFVIRVQFDEESSQ